MKRPENEGKNRRGERREALEPVIKGVRAGEVLELLGKGLKDGQIRALYPELTGGDIEAVRRWRDYRLIPPLIDSGMPLAEVARRYGLSRSGAWAIKEAIVEWRRREKEWGGLSARAVNAIRFYLKCSSLEEFKGRGYTDAELRRVRNIGAWSLADIRKVVPAPQTIRLAVPVPGT